MLLYSLAMRFALLVVVVCGGVGLPGAGPVAAQTNATATVNATRLDLRESVQLGLERSPRIEARAMAIKRARSRSKSAQGQFLPSASMNSGYSKIGSLYAKGPTDQDYLDQANTYINLRVMQRLFAGLTVLNRYQKAKVGIALAEAEKRQAEQELIREIQNEYLRLLKAREDVRSLEQTVERLQTNREAAQAFFNVSMLPYVKVLEAEVELADARQQLSKARSEVRTQTIRLNALLDYPSEAAVDYGGDLKAVHLDQVPSLATCLQLALDVRPEITVFEKNIAMAEEEAQVRAGKFAPNVNLTADFYHRKKDYDKQGQSFSGSYDMDQTNQYWSAGIEVQWKLFAGGSRYHDYQEMEFEISRLKRRLQNARNQIQSEVSAAYNKLVEAKGRVRSTREAIGAAQENYSREQTRFKKGLGTMQELLDSQTRLTRAEVKANQAMLDYRLAMAELFYAMGQRNLTLRSAALKKG